MELKDLAFRVGLPVLGRALEPSSIDKIDQRTAKAVNTYCLQHPLIGQIPFPRLDEDDNVLSTVFEIDSWGRVWFQRFFWLHYPTTQNEIPVVVKIRWIIGRDAPQEVVVDASSNTTN